MQEKTSGGVSEELQREGAKHSENVKKSLYFEKISSWGASPPPPAYGPEYVNYRLCNNIYVSCVLFCIYLSLDIEFSHCTMEYMASYSTFC